MQTKSNNKICFLDLKFRSHDKIFLCISLPPPTPPLPHTVIDFQLNLCGKLALIFKLKQWTFEIISNEKKALQKMWRKFSTQNEISWIELSWWAKEFLAFFPSVQRNALKWAITRWVWRPPSNRHKHTHSHSHIHSTLESNFISYCTEFSFDLQNKYGGARIFNVSHFFFYTLEFFFLFMKTAATTTNNTTYLNCFVLFYLAIDFTRLFFVCDSSIADNVSINRLNFKILSQIKLKICFFLLLLKITKMSHIKQFSMHSDRVCVHILFHLSVSFKFLFKTKRKKIIIKVHT